MSKYKIFEQFKQDEALEKFKAITDPTLRLAAASECFPEGYVINVKHPETGVMTIQAISKKPENANNKFVFFKPDFTLDYRTTADEKGKTIKTTKWSCYALLERTNPEVSKVQGELLSALETKLGWKKNADVSGNEILNYDLTNVATDPDLKPGGMYHNVVKGVQQFMDDLVASNRPFYMWKPKKMGAGVKKMDEEQNRILALPEFSGYKICSVPEPEKGPDHVIAIDIKYPDYFEKGTKLCRPQGDFSPKQVLEKTRTLSTKVFQRPNRQDCRNLILSYYELIQRQIPISQNMIDQIKPSVQNCSTAMKFPGLNEKIRYMQRIRTKGKQGEILNFGLTESKNDELSTLVSESLTRLKIQKTKKFITEGREVRKRIEFIFESIEVRNKRDVELLADCLLGEMVRLRNEGYDEMVISEQMDLLSSLTGFFSGGKGGDFLSGLKGAAGGGLMSTVVETIAGGLLKTMGIDPKGTLGTLILKTITNLTPADFPKLSDCRFVSGLITKSVLETIAAEATKSIGGKTMVGSFIENTLFELGEQSEIFQSIKNFIGDKIVCPYLEGKGGNVLSSIFGEK
jgi:hypothetical protein